MTFEPNLTQRLVRKAKGRLAKDWRSRWRDYSTQLAKVGALVQGALVMIPPEDLPKNLNAYVAVLFFVLIGLAKLITEPDRDDK